MHALGTVLNDEFKGATAWDDYLTKLESAKPALRAIGITDYYSTETYERCWKPSGCPYAILGPLAHNSGGEAHNALKARGCSSEIPFPTCC